MKASLLILLFGLTGCVGSGWVRTGRVNLNAPGNANTPSTVNSGQKTTETMIPAGTEKRTVETEGTATTPAKKETIYTFAKETKEKVTESSDSVTLSNERAPDQTLGIHQANLADRRVLLYASMGALAIGLLAKTFFPLWPGAPTSCFIAAAILFGSWKFSEVPWWAALIAIVGYLLIATGYKKGEVDANKNGIPDFLEPKKVTTQTTTVVEPTP